jgi:myo-inositol-1(or 4)-monophosphatase
MKHEITEYLKTAKSAAISAGNYLFENFNKKHSAQYKSANDVVLAVDKKSESIILNIITAKYPLHNIYSEELGEIKSGSKFTWFIDPLDGTNNYFAGIPYFSISIALLFEDEVIIGVVYNPISKQFFEASKNGGAFLNGKIIRTTKSIELQKSVCSFIQGHLVSTSNYKIESDRIRNKLADNFRRVISTWAPALDWALLASGGIDALISFESEYEDMYAGLLIALEAGVVVTNFNGESLKKNEQRIIATKKGITSNIIELINR